MMKVLVLGAGAVGCILGASLLKAGHDVTFLARESTLDAFRRNGLLLEWPSEKWHFEKVRAIGLAAPSENFDFLLFCVKGYDWESASELIPHFPSEYVLTFQNGVLVHHELRRRFGNNVFGSVIYVGADRTAPHRVVAKSTARVIVDGNPDVYKKMKEFCDALTNPHVKALLSENIELELWRKYLFLCPFSAINTLTEKSIGPIMQEPQTRELFAHYMEEIVSVGNNSGVKLSGDDVTAVLENASKFPPATSSSLFADYRRGQRTEVELLQGYLVRLVEKYSIPAPISHTIYALLKLKTTTV